MNVMATSAAPRIRMVQLHSGGDVPDTQHSSSPCAPHPTREAGRPMVSAVGDQVTATSDSNAEAKCSLERNDRTWLGVQIGMRKALWIITTTLAATTAIGGCAGGPGKHGTVTGVFLMVGGPAPGVNVRLPGRVIATGTNGQRLTVPVSTDGRFAIHLPPGTYKLTGYSPRVHVGNQEMRCVATHRVHVRGGKSTRGNVYCSVP